MSTSGKHLLVVDDDPKLRELLRRYLTENQFEVSLAQDGPSMNRLMQRQPFDLVVLDLMMPGEDGLSIVRRLRGAGDATPVIMLTAKGDDVDRIVGLELGADDYLPKPCNPRELVARIRALVRRTTGRAASGAERLRVGRLAIDVGARAVQMDGRAVSLTHYEFELLLTLARAVGRPLSRDQLLDALKGQEYDTFDRSIDVHISNLRAKLEPNPKAPTYIKTVRGVGYLLVREVS